mmetsp:Transcript_44548/g.83602  ORF Transcript_44548/g.83602 Transcript_44548/m.83602 type:complete len:230 (-) Transcript_44548:506-1195(-)
MIPLHHLHVCGVHSQERSCDFQGARLNVAALLNLVELDRRASVPLNLMDELTSPANEGADVLVVQFTGDLMIVSQNSLRELSLQLLHRLWTYVHWHFIIVLLIVVPIIWPLLIMFIASTIIPISMPSSSTVVVSMSAVVGRVPVTSTAVSSALTSVTVIVITSTSTQPVRSPLGHPVRGHLLLNDITDLLQNLLDCVNHANDAHHLVPLMRLIFHEDLGIVLLAQGLNI